MHTYNMEKISNYLISIFIILLLGLQVDNIYDFAIILTPLFALSMNLSLQNNGQSLKSVMFWRAMLTVSSFSIFISTIGWLREVYIF
jgi:hypothetical protein